MDVVYSLAAIQNAITCFTTLSSSIKSVKEMDQKIASHDIREHLLELQERLLDAKGQMSELIYQNQELKQQLTIKKEILHQEDGNILWRVVDGQKKGPYCSTCYGVASKLIPLSEICLESWNCPHCKNHYRTHQWKSNQKKGLEQLNNYYNRNVLR